MARVAIITELQLDAGPTNGLHPTGSKHPCAVPAGNPRSTRAWPCPVSTMATTWKSSRCVPPSACTCEASRQLRKGPWRDSNPQPSVLDQAFCAVRLRLALAPYFLATARMEWFAALQRFAPDAAGFSI